MIDYADTVSNPKPAVTALIVAAGVGLRVGGDVPKQYAVFRGMPMLRHSLLAFRRWRPDIDIVVAIGAGQQELAANCAVGLDRIMFVEGGTTRRESVGNGLQAIQKRGGTGHVFIHDAARPGLSSAVLDRLADALGGAKAAVPVLPVVDSLSRGYSATLADAIDRAGLWRIQTPQAFDFATIFMAHQHWPDTVEATDDARMAQAAGHAVAMVEGAESLKKITFSEDLSLEDTVSPEALTMHQADIRTGLGYDVHRLAEGEDLWLGGLKIEHDKGLAGHSDADVALHAITDAVLGAAALGDIGDHFPPNDPQWRGARSAQFLAHAAALVTAKGASILNIDLTIICEAPKIGPHKVAMRERIAGIVGIAVDRISVKATTTERLGFTGRGEGIAAQAIATIRFDGEQASPARSV